MIFGADNGDILINNGQVAVQGGTPSVSNTNTILALGLGGNDQIALNEFNGALPRAFLLGGSGNDLLIGGAGRDYLSGSTGNDLIVNNDDEGEVDTDDDFLNATDGVFALIARGGEDNQPGK